MNCKFEGKNSSFCVSNFVDSQAIPCSFRLESESFVSRKIQPRLNPSFLRKQFVLLLLFSLLSGWELSAAEIPFAERSLEKSNDPLSITSDKMVFQNLKDKIVFEGKVVIKKRDLILESDRAEIFLIRAAKSLSSKKGAESQQVSKIIASGNVRIKKGTQQAKAEKGVFDRMKEVIILTGNPEVWEEGYRIKGKEITFFMDEERTLVTESEVVIQNTSGDLNLRDR